MSTTTTTSTPVSGAAVPGIVIPTNGEDTAVQNAATTALEQTAPIPADPAASFNAGFPADSPHYTNNTWNIKFKAPRKDRDGKPPVDNYGNPIETRPPVSLTFPVPTWEGVKAFVAGDQKNRDWLLDIIQDVVKDAVRDQVYDEANPVSSQDQLKVDILNLNYLVNIPKVERTGRGIAKEIWEEFGKDYMEVMVAQGTRTPEKVGNAAEAFIKKLNPVKTNKKLVTFLRNELNTWAGVTNNLEEYMGIYEFLKKKADTYINEDEESQLNNFQ